MCHEWEWEREEGTALLWEKEEEEEGHHTYDGGISHSSLHMCVSLCVCV